MHPFRYAQGSRAIVTVLGLLVVLTVVTPGAAQDMIHKFLERQSPGQPKGSATAPVIMEEFSDFQCSYCGKFARETLPRLAEAYIDTGKVRLIFRHFAVLGPASEAAGEASACAGAQEQFWPYHDRLFAAQGHLTFTRNTFLRLAQELRLNVTDFTECLDTRHFRAQVQSETKAATALGLRGTPGFVINGRPLVGALPLAMFQSVIEEALATAASGALSSPPADKPPSQPPAK